MKELAEKKEQELKEKEWKEKELKIKEEAQMKAEQEEQRRDGNEWHEVSGRGKRTGGTFSWRSGFSCHRAWLPLFSQCSMLPG